MPKKVREFGPLEVKRAAHPGHADRNHWIAVGGVSGLLLQITPNGSKSWILRTIVGTKRRAIGLGGYPEVSLAAAREAARAAKARVVEGADPIEERKAIKAALAAAQKRGLLFKDAVGRYCAAKLDGLRNEKHRDQWRATLETYAVPTMGDMLVSDINVHDVLRALEPIWTGKTETASRLRGRIEAVLDWAKVKGHRTGENPAAWKGNLDALLPKPGQVKRSKNQPALALGDAAAWFSALRKRNGTAARALEFLVLTAARSGEVRGAVWEEFDLKAGLWTIPAERMKAKREHRVPLTPAALAIVTAMPKLGGSSFVFAAPRGGELSDMSLSAVMRRMQEEEIEVGRKGWLDPRSSRPAVPHGWRSTFRDWAAERTDYSRDMAEIALAHDVGTEVERAYRRGDMLEKRRAMMSSWADFLGGKAVGVVVSFPVQAQA